jgi:hypothetical protein
MTSGFCQPVLGYIIIRLFILALAYILNCISILPPQGALAASFRELCGFQRGHLTSHSGVREALTACGRK